MKNFKLLSILGLAFVLAFTSCKKDEETTSAPLGKMTSTIDGKSFDFNVQAISTSTTTGGKTYKTITLTGASVVSMTDTKSFAVTVYGETISTKKYMVPVYTTNFTYDYITGFAVGVYVNNNNGTQSVYASFNTQNASGSVTITSISDTNIQGSYDMILTLSTDNTKTMPLKGSFNANVTKYNY